MYIYGGTGCGNITINIIIIIDPLMENVRRKGFNGGDTPTTRTSASGGSK